MPSRKITELENLTSPNGLDVLYIIDDVAGTPTSKQITLNKLFGNVPANTNVGRLSVTSQATLANTTASRLTVSGTTSVASLTVSSNGIILENTLTPANSSVSAIPVGKIFYDSNYIYVKVATNTIKRLALSSF